MDRYGSGYAEMVIEKVLKIMKKELGNKNLALLLLSV